MSTPSKFDDLIDIRDVIARLDELREEYTDLSTALEELRGDPDAEPDDVTAAEDALKEWDIDNGDEQRALQSLADQAEGYADDWRHGATLIHDDYFKKYAQKLAEDIGAIPESVAWPCTCIDWDQAADELRQDYTAVDFDGETYWVH